MQIPSGVYTKYAEAMSMFIDVANFGTPCKLIYASVETSSITLPDVRQHLTMSPPAGKMGSVRGTETTRIVGTMEEVVLRAYWDKKSFRKISDIDMPDGGCMTIAGLDLLDNFKRAQALIISSDRSSEYRYVKIAEPLVWGLNSNYAVAYWGRS